MTSVLDIRGFAREALEHLGCLVEPAPGEMLEAVLTPHVAQAMRVPEMVRLAFDTGGEGVRLQPGQPALDGLLDLWTAEPVISRQRLALPDRATASKALAAIEADMAFPNARAIWDSAAWGLSRWTRCGFRASFISDERRDLVQAVVFDATRGCLVDEAPGGEPAGPESWAEHTAVPTTMVLERSAQAAQALLQQRVASWLRRCADRSAIEQSRAHEYFETLQAELQRRLRSAQQRQADTASIETKLATLQLEAERRQRDLADKHGVRSLLKLAVFECIEAPRARAAFHVANRYASAQGHAWFNPFTRTVEPPLCQRCSVPTASLWLCNQGHLVCEACVRGCRTCRRVQCRDCGMGDCPRCGQPWCDTCQRVHPGCKTCGTVQCENCASTQSCHRARPTATAAVVVEPVATVVKPRLQVCGHGRDIEWQRWMPADPVVRATTSDAAGDMAVFFTVRHGKEAPVLAVRFNVWTGRVARIDSGVLRQSERKAVLNALRPPHTSWMDLQWPFPALLAAEWLEQRRDENLCTQVQRMFPRLRPALLSIGGPSGTAFEAPWELEAMRLWEMPWLQHLDCRELLHRFREPAVWKRIVEAYRLGGKQCVSAIHHQLVHLLACWACAGEAVPHELAVLELTRNIDMQGFNSPALQALLRRTLERQWLAAC